MNISTRPLIASAVALVCLSACGGVSEMTREQVARSETAVRQAETSIGRSEAGAIELQQAKDNYAQARKAIDEGEDEAAQRYATKAELNAQLAVAKAQNASARKAADELLASIETLRRESQRATAPR